MPFQREIWLVKQKESATNTEPEQPSDSSKPLRPYLVVSSCQLYSKLQVTLLPIQTSKPNIAYRVELLPTKENGLANASWVICSQLFTIDNAFLYKKLGIVNQDDFNLIHASVTAYLAIRS
jgi:mRNA-degrading endonuclease toxin of MazEF toxin-antitoxin module